MERITTAVDAQDIAVVEVKLVDYRSHDGRVLGDYHSRIRVSGHVVFNGIIGRKSPQGDWWFAAGKALDALKSILLREMTGPIAAIPRTEFRDSPSPDSIPDSLDRDDRDVRMSGFRLAMDFKHTARRPKEIMSEDDWQELLNNELIESAFTEAALAGVQAMIDRMRDEEEEDRIIRLSRGIREHVRKEAEINIRYKQRLAALEAEFKAEREVCLEQTFKKFNNGEFKTDEPEAQGIWDEMSRAARTLMRDSVMADQLNSSSGGFTFLGALSQDLKDKLEELRQEEREEKDRAS